MMLSSKIKQGICCATHSLLLCVLTLGAGVTAADDTDVFFGQTLDDQETRPNVLLVLDTSGSMSRTDGGVTSRLSRMKAAVRQILESDIDMNIGLMGYNGNGGGGPILYPVTNLGDVVCSGLDCENVDVREDVYDVDGGLGDIEETLNGGNIDSGGNTLSLGSSGMGPQGLGLRFADINVFRGATILDAHIQFVARRTEADDADFIIEVEDVGDAQAYGTTVGELSSRQYSTNTLLWNPEEWNQNVAYETIDVGQLVQSVITRSDWCNGNALSFKISGTGTRRASSWESAAANSELIPKLRIRLDNSSAVAAFGCGNSVTSALAPIVAPDSGLGVPGVAGIASQLTAAEIAVARSEMLQVIDDLTSVGGTPTVDALYEAALYMRGEGVHFGGFRGVTTRNSRKERFRVSHQDSYTGGTLVREADCTDDNLNARACVGEQIIGDAQYISPIGGSCQPNHIVLLSDGNPRGTVLQPEIQSLIGQSQCSGAGSEACAVDLASWLNSADQSNDFDAVQSIITSTIAFNLDGDSDFLESVALAGGGIAYDAASTDELIAVFGEIAENVADVDASFTAPAATVNQFNRLSHRDDLYFALFRPEVKPRWNGNIKRFKLGAENDGSGDVLIRDRDGYPAIDENTGNFSIQSRSFWPGKNDDGTVNNEADGANVAEGGAANQLALTGLQGIGARRVYTWTGDPSIEISTPVDLTAVEQRFHESNTEITDELLGIEGQGANSTEQAELRENLIKWARGVDVLDSDTDGSVVDARRQMGDPMHSRPVVVNYAIPGNSDAVRSLVFVGTNEGYLHALDADSGEEQFAFVPGELLKNHDTFFSDSSSFKRPYGLDGPISVWRDDVNDNQTVDTGDSAFLFVGMRRGGNSFYALDITDPDRPKLAWTITGGAGGSVGFENMGQSWSRLTPVKMFINDSAKDVLIFGGGYDTAQDELAVETAIGTSARTHPKDQVGNGLYIVEATTGELIWSGLGEGSGTKFFSNMEYGFNGGIRAIDINRDQYVDQIYAADSGGQVWRFDVTQNHLSNVSTLIQGGVIADISDSDPSAHRRFYNEPDVALVERDGERFLTVSIGSGARANPLDEVIEDRFYMIRQNSVFEAPTVYGKSLGLFGSTPITESDLVNVSNSVTPITNEFGWYLELSKAGEKVLGTSVTFGNTVFFGTYVPTEQVDVCSPGIGSGRAYVLDLVTGGPVLDLFDPDNNNADQLTLEDRSTELLRGGIPPEAIVLVSKDALDEPQVLFGAEQLDVELINSTRRTFWSDQGESGEIISSSNP